MNFDKIFNMEKYLKPSKFESSPNSPKAAKEWDHWLRIFENFLKASEFTTDEDKYNILITFLSTEVYELVNECAGYEEATGILNQTYKKKVNDVFARYQLTQRKQQPGETVKQYIQALQSLSKECEFKSVTASEYRNQFVRDAFVSGLLSSNIRQRLLENDSINLEDAVQRAVALEVASEQAEQYSQHLNQPSVNSVAPLNSGDEMQKSTLPEAFSAAVTRKQPTDKCYFCGYDKHPRSKCPARDATCGKCKKTGHYAKVCRSAFRPNNSSDKPTPAEQTSSVIASVNNSALAKAQINGFVNGISVTCLIDTGSTGSFVNNDFVVKHSIHSFLESGQVSMASTCLSSQLKGSIVVDLILSGHQYKNQKLSILNDLCADVLIGHDIMKMHSSVNVAFGGERKSLQICNSISTLLEPCKLFANLSPDCRPIATKSRRFSDEDNEFIRSETYRLLSEGIIQESSSPWRAQVLVTKKETHKKRLVIDYSQTINKFTLLDAYPLPEVDAIVRKVANYKIFSSIDLRNAYHQIPILPEERKFTAFEACGKLYEFTRIPFGVTNGVAFFQRTIDRIIKNEGLNGVVGYLDDITVCGMTAEEHEENLSKFLASLRKYGLEINEKKSVFSQQSIKLLGNLVSYKSIKPDTERLKPLLDLPPPIDMPSLKRILGSFAYYAKWIKNFSNKIQNLLNTKSFPLTEEALQEFKDLKKEIAEAAVTTISKDIPLVVETDASDSALAATLSQDNRPVAFFSRTLSKSERFYSAFEKEASAIMEALRKWKVYLIGNTFKLITDQQALSFIFNKKQSNKIKNDKVMRWRIELAPYDYEIAYRPGTENTKADMFSRVCGSIHTKDKLFELHQALCHPGVIRMNHWVKSKNLPYSLDEIKDVTSRCVICSEVKPQFVKSQGKLIKSTAPLERLNVDFKGPIPSATRNKYMLTIVDEYSRFPFAFPCSDISSETVIRCFTQLFHLTGLPSYVHSDRGTSFMSNNVTSFLQSLGVATSRTTPYNPRGNGQVERYNGVIWRSITLALKTKNLSVNRWESVLPEALHAVRSLLCTSTNCTPHERFFAFVRKSANGTTLPHWLREPGPVFVRKYVRDSKYDDLVEEAQLLHANPEYAWIRRQDGSEATVSLRHLAPKGDLKNDNEVASGPYPEQSANDLDYSENIENVSSQHQTSIDHGTSEMNFKENVIPSEPSFDSNRSSDVTKRLRRPPAYLKDYVLK